MKAQMVKNAVIVPDRGQGRVRRQGRDGRPGRSRRGARGRHRPVPAIRAEPARRDRQRGRRRRRAPARHASCTTSDDPYLVVAADKGTATFSDIANEIAAEYDFWLGDAFASGGSNGYDHKEMGITARGAWESVRRHARVLGLDVDRDPLTVVGIGDMSGDVFGNGMLLSDNLRLVAAFDHRHIFLDPDPPDPARAHAERRRLFELPRSSWADYDASLISAGGGVYPRTLKSIAITDEVREALGLDDDVDASASRRADLGDPAGAGRPALERRHRHVREGVDRDPRGGRRPGQRRGCASTRRCCAAGWSARAAISASPSWPASSTRSPAGSSTPTRSTTRPASTAAITRSTSRSRSTSSCTTASSRPSSATRCSPR